MEQKNWLVKTGDFLFKYRNLLFPSLLVLLFASYKTAHEYDGSEEAEDIKDWVAMMIVAAGLAIRAAVIGFKYIKRGGMNKKVYADKLVTDGFFGLCRNPLYVGNLTIYFGVLLMHGSPWVLAIGMSGFLFIYTAIVAAEEYFLRNEFGEAYVEYCRDVPRWGIKFLNFRKATQGMHFNWKRALIKDYGTIVNAVIAVSLLSLLEDMQFADYDDANYWYAAIAITLVLGFAVRIAKKRRFLVAS